MSNSGQYLPLSCFGKLPGYAEHLEHKVAYPSSRAMLQWVREGRATADLVGSESGEGRFYETRCYRFVVGTPGSVELAAGVLRPSHDQANRRYPFCVLTHFPRKLFKGNYRLLPFALSSLWDALDDAWDTLFAAAGRSTIEEILGGTLVPAPAPVSTVKGSYQGSQRESATHLFQRSDGSDYGALRQNFPQVLERLRKSNGEGLTLELPISEELENGCFETSFWIDLINHQFLLRRFEPDLFIDETRDGEPRCVRLRFGKPAPEDYAWLMAGREAGESLLRPAHAPLPEEAAPLPDGLTFQQMIAGKMK